MGEKYRFWLRWLTRVGLLAGCLVAIAACGSTGASKSGVSLSTAHSCSGPALKLFTITNASAPIGSMQGEYWAGQKAAAAAATKSCELGGPVQVITCDDQFSPNKDAACAREAVADKVDAVLASSAAGDVYASIVTRAGIPILPLVMVSATESTSPLSYPFGYSLTALLGEVQLAHATGGHKLVVAAIGLPEVAFAVNLVKGAASKFGMQFLHPIEIPPTATDMTQYAAQVKASGADSMLSILGEIQDVALYKDLYADGVNGENTRLVDSLETMTPKFVKQLGPAANGLLEGSWVISPTETSNPIVSQYLSESKAAGQPTGPQDVDMASVEGWAQVHVLADALHAAGLKPSPANVKTALEQRDIPALTAKYGVSPIDFTKPAFTGALSKLRIFSQYHTGWELNATGVPQPLAGGRQISVFSTLKISR